MPNCFGTLSTNAYLFAPLTILQLAKKLRECNVFGVSSDECLNYAMQNRMEWEAKGLEATASMLEAAQSNKAIRRQVTFDSEIDGAVDV